MHGVALSIMLMQECRNPVLGNSFVNGTMYQGCAYKNKAIEHIIHLPYLTPRVISLICAHKFVKHVAQSVQTYLMCTLAQNIE